MACLKESVLAVLTKKSVLVSDGVLQKISVL